jgi:Prolyl-tRNA synthetase
MRGIPLRVEVGPRDIENSQCVVVRRDTGEKLTVAFDELENKVAELLVTIQKDMLERARNHRDSNTHTAKNWDEFKDIIENKQGFIKAMWCGETECEENIKAETGASTRCMPFEQEQIADTCVCCGKPAKKMVYFGRAY